MKNHDIFLKIHDFSWNMWLLKKISCIQYCRPGSNIFKGHQIYIWFDSGAISCGKPFWWLRNPKKTSIFFGFRAPCKPPKSMFLLIFKKSYLHVGERYNLETLHEWSSSRGLSSPPRIPLYLSYIFQDGSHKMIIFMKINLTLILWSSCDI